MKENIDHTARTNVPIPGGVVMATETYKDHIRVPESLLKSQELLPTAKLVWITLMLDLQRKAQEQLSKTSLAAITGLSRPTINKAIGALEASGWYVEEKPCIKGKIYGPSVTIYTDLILDTALSVRARLFHGMLQLTANFKAKIMQFKYSPLSKELNMGLRSVRCAMGQLAKSGWFKMKQINQLAPIILNLNHPIREQFRVMFARAKKNLTNPDHFGDALMKEILSTLVATDDYMDNVRPGFLRNSNTDCLLELDRYYPNVVAFEFNGTQHYEPTDIYDAATVEKQKFRDKLKKQLCADKGIKLITIHAQDLTIEGMLKKIGDILPLRNLRGGERLIEFLENASANYRRNSPYVLSES